MLNFINTRIFFGLLLTITLLLDLEYEVPKVIYLLVIAGYLSITAYGSYFIQSDFFIKSFWRGSKNSKTIAITFDDGPFTEYTAQVLDILKENKVPAAFFLIGKNMRGNEAIVKRMDQDGHLIGNHSYSHTFWFSLNGSNTILKDLKRCDAEIFKIIGKQPKFFRPPYGVLNPMVKGAIQKGNYHCIGWSIRTYDTVAKSKEQLLAKSLKNISNGDVILFHDWGQFTIGILYDFIRQVRAQGFEIVRADELFNVKAYY